MPTRSARVLHRNERGSNTLSPERNTCSNVSGWCRHVFHQVDATVRSFEHAGRCWTADDQRLTERGRCRPPAARLRQNSEAWAVLRFVSLGHSTKTLNDFVALVRGARIGAVTDIRRFPRSRRHPHFSRTSLERELTSRGIGYEWLGEELGGFRDEGYDAWMRTDTFARGVQALETLARTQLLGFMCSEGEPWKCHRRFVSRALSQRGHHVEHLLPDGSVIPEDPQLALPVL